MKTFFRVIIFNMVFCPIFLVAKEGSKDSDGNFINAHGAET